VKENSFVRSLGYALKGLEYALISERNMRIHLVATVLVLILGYCFQLTNTEWALIIFAVSLVWAAEIVNTSLEELVDLVSPEPDVKAGRAKNLAAGAVLVAAINAVIIGVLVFFPHILHWWRGRYIV
jgi:diacylglycerol kinase